MVALHKKIPLLNSNTFFQYFRVMCTLDYYINFMNLSSFLFNEFSYNEVFRWSDETSLNDSFTVHE